MSPRLPMNNSFYCFSTYIETGYPLSIKFFFGRFSIRPFFSYFNNISWNHFRVTRFFSSSIMNATLIQHVYNIFFCCSKPKMLRIYTRPVVSFWKTIMQHAKSFRYISIFNNPRSSMGIKLFAISTGNSIATLRNRPLPYPAMRSFFYFLPESYFKTFHSKFVITRQASSCSCIAINKTIFARINRWVHV